MRIIIGINGSSGVIYGIRLLQVLESIPNLETHLVVTRAGEQTIEIETEYKASRIAMLPTAPGKIPPGWVIST